jgi:hypothetical protein
MVARIACTMVERIEVGKRFLLIEGASKGFWSSNARWPVMASSISIVFDLKL